MYIAVGILSVISYASADGILYPQTSETREIIYLDGFWNFALSNSSNPLRGHLEEWYKKNLKVVSGLEVTSMPVPSSYNDIGPELELRDHVGPVWYQRKFFVSKSWSSKRVWLRFSSASYSAEAWINGKWAVSHSLGHLPFQAEVTQLLNFGSQNNITVVVDNTLTQFTVPQGSQEELISGRIKQSYPFDFFNYAGIDRPVVLYTTPTTYIDDITVNTTIDGTTGIINYEISVEGNDILSPRIQLFSKDKSVVASSNLLAGTLTISNANFWWPYLMNENPGYLYTLQVQLLDSFEEVFDTYRLSVGIRSVTWDNTSLSINNKPVYLRGFGRHEDSDIKGKGLDLPLIARDHNLIKWVGANSYRTSHYPYAEEIMDVADELGIIIIDECPAVSLSGFSDQLLENHKQSITEMIQRDKNRPSVIIWSAANEPSSNLETAEAYFKAVIDHVKSLDVNRPVTVTNFYSAEDQHIGQFLDIASFNIYQAWYENTGDLDVIFSDVVTKTKQWHDKYNIPVLITEYGADTIPGLHLLPAYVWSEEFQDQLLSQYFKAFDVLRAQGFFIGEHIWNFADFNTAQSTGRVGGNKKGIFTRDRQPKASAHLMRKRYWALAQDVDGAEIPDDLNGYVYENKANKDEL